jgi:hypothetical protein
MSSLEDLPYLPAALRDSARLYGREVAWHMSDAAAAIESLTALGRIVLGLDLREYQVDGTFIETPWGSYSGVDPRESRDAAFRALERDDRARYGDWVLVTWGSVGQVRHWRAVHEWPAVP